MNRSDLQRWIPLAALAGAAGMLLGLARFGIWDPAEVEVSEIARRFAAGEKVTLPHVGPWLVGLSFRVFGVHEWSGRLPIALCGLVLLVLTYRLVAAFADRRAALYALLIAGSSPLFIFNAGTMLGEAPTLAIQSAIALSALRAVYADDDRRRLAWLIAAIAAVVIGVTARGALLCPLPPLAAVAVLSALDGQLGGIRERRTAALSAWLFWALTLVLLGLVARAVLADRATHSIWLGGAPVAGQPPSFDAVLERVFHAFAPWSALLPLALGWIFARGEAVSDEERSEHRLRLFVLLWAAFGYAALTLFLSRYGPRAAVVPVAGLAAAVALWLRDVERSRASQWPAAIGAALLALLVLRDYALYPNSPLHGLPLADFAVPDGFNPRLAWAAVLLPFCVAAMLGLGHDPQAPVALDLRRPYRALVAQWRRGLAFKLWLLGFALVLIGLEVFGLCTFLPVSRRLTTLGIKVGRGLMLVPPALPLVVAAVQVALYGFGRLRERRTLPMFLAGIAVAGYAAFGFMPALSSQLSPRDVYAGYNQLAGPGESLAEYRVGARAAAYYAKGSFVEVDTLTGLIDHLAADARRWAVFPSDELAEIDRAFRQRKARHLFVVDARNARALLASNQPIAGKADQNAIARYVRSEVPAIEHPLLVNFDDKIHLLGYALKLPRGDHVGQGEHIDITWYFKALRSVPGSYRVFVHIDTPGNRIGGDHDPVAGKYPVRLWSSGDVIIDEQRIEVPNTAISGTYTIFMGLYSGDTRLPIKDGPRDEVNRANAGVLRIR